VIIRVNSKKRAKHVGSLAIFVSFIHIPQHVLGEMVLLTLHRKQCILLLEHSAGKRARTRYGTSGGGVVREANPLSCYECGLRPKCVGFNKIVNLNVSVSSQLQKGLQLANFTVVPNKEGVPKFVYNAKDSLIDEFSGLILHTQKTNNIGKTVTIEAGFDFVSADPNGTQYFRRRR
jgi:hypothetical protein